VDLALSRPEDRPALEAFLRGWNALHVARRDELVDSLSHPAVLAWSAGKLCGVATYLIARDDCELLTLHAENPLKGIGTELLGNVQEIARRAGCTRLRVVTTNDNVDALRFYQRRGFRLVALRPGAVDRSRALLKPEIPESGAYAIPLRDELELEMDLS
jgi:ribosomal protein S18 acetylase RimI-like enzyme